MATKYWYDETLTDGDTVPTSSFVDMATRLKTISPANGELKFKLSLTTEASTSFTTGELGMLSSSGVIKADASAENTCAGLLLIATEDISAGDSGYFLILGKHTNSGWSFTKGDVLYVSETSGAITNTMPTTSGSIVRIIGYALSSTEILFNPDNTYIENS